jgi:AcrR family transcriptional regulator
MSQQDELATEPGTGRGLTIAAEQRIRDIVRGAARLFDEIGYHATNMEMVAHAAQLRKPTLYHYIKSKEEILLRIHQALIDDFAATHQVRAEQGYSREAQLLGIVTDILSAIADNGGYVRAFFEHYRELDPEMRRQISVKRQAYFKCVTDLIAEGVAAGDYHTADVRMSALFLLGQVNWAYTWYVPGKSPRPEVIAQQLLDSFLHGMARADGSRPRRRKPAARALPRTL